MWYRIYGWTARAGSPFLDCREQDQELTLIKDIEQELNVTKSVASNLGEAHGAKWFGGIGNESK